MIRVPKVRVIDENGEQLGILDSFQARELAASRGLDLVEVAAQGDPPVCRIMDYGKFKYQQQKKIHDAKKKQTVIQIKEIRMRPKTEEHDFQVKVRAIRRFLEDGDKVKVTLLFRGREITHADLAKRHFAHVAEEVKDLGAIEQHAIMEGRRMNIIIAPHKKR